jgi:short chain dehydrogenase
MGNGGAAASWFGGCALQAPRPAGVGDVRTVARQYRQLAGKDPDVAWAEMLRIVKQLLPLDARTRRAGELPRPVTRAEFELAVDALLRFYVSGRHTDESSMARAVDRAWSRLGGIDMLVNNAGIGMRTVNPRFMTHPQGFWEVPVGGFRAVVETNLTWPRPSVCSRPRPPAQLPDDVRDRWPLGDRDGLSRHAASRRCFFGLMQQRGSALTGYHCPEVLGSSRRVMTEQEPVGDDERVARLIQAASELIDAYERKSTANQHFLKLEAAVDTLGGSPRTQVDHNPATPPVRG